MYQVVKSLGQAKPPGDLTVKRVAPLDIDNDPIWKWFNDIRDKGMAIKERTGMRKNGSVVIYDTTNTEVARWNFFNAWPSKISNDSFSAGGAEAVNETIVLTIERLERKK
jgi:phage tail-like protein